MKKNDMIKLIEAKDTDLKSVIASLKTNCANENTRGTQLYAKKKERRILNLVKSLVVKMGDEVTLSDDDRDIFVLLTKLSTEVSPRSSVVCKDGDNIIEILQKYSDVKNVSEKLNKYCEKNNLVLNYTTGKVESIKPKTTKN